MVYLFLTNMQLLSSQDVNLWTGVVWITCGLLWCFYQMFGLSFWRHPFTAEHPLVLIGSELLISASSCQFLVQHEWAGQWSDSGRSVPSLGFPCQVIYDTAHIYISNTSENNAFQLPQTPEDDWKWEVSHNCWSLGPNAQNIHLQSSSEPISEDVFYSEHKRMWQWALGLFVQVHIGEKKVGDL